MKWFRVGLIVLLCLPSFASAKRVTRDKLPPAVVATMDREAKGATIQSIFSEYSFRHRMYEIETVVNGHSRNLRIDPGGKVDEIEEEVPFDSLPIQVQDSLLRKAKGGKLVKVESVTMKGRITAYEARVSKDGKVREVRVAHKESKVN